MGIIALLVFWIAIARVWIADGPRIPLLFIVIWLVSAFATSYFESGSYIFISVEAIMAAILLLIGQYKS